MGVLDNIKDSIPGSGSSSSSGSSSFSGSSDDFGGLDSDSGSDFDSSDFDSSFQDDSLDQSPQQSSPGLDPNSPGNQQSNGMNSSQGPGAQPGQNQPSTQEPSVNPRRDNSQRDQKLQRTDNRQQPNPPNKRGGHKNAPRDSPNPQTGRPRRGDSEPQLSRQTEKQLENVGMMDSNNQSVSDRSGEIEELKRQNEQIIELLKRLNNSMENNSGSTGRRRHR